MTNFQFSITNFQVVRAERIDPVPKARGSVNGAFTAAYCSVNLEYEDKV